MDKISVLERSENMRRIRGKNTSPELLVRRLLRSIGYPGYRIHWKGLPGRPDVVFVGREKVIVIHGCFWHGHDCKKGVRKPNSNRDYWIPKLERNRERDANNMASLEAAGWSVFVVWECELKDIGLLSERLCRFLLEQAVN